jgi:acyl-CoA synthetase (AMP-forming)/AMP-acid ligase II
VDHVEMQVQTGHHTPPPAGVPYRPVAVHDAPVRCETDGAVWHVLAILSGNDLEHLQLALGAMWAGVPYAPVSPPYALVSTDFGKLRHVFDVLTPGLVYAADGGAFDKAIDAVVPEGIAAADTRDHGRRRTGRRRARHAGEDPLHLGLHA